MDFLYNPADKVNDSVFKIRKAHARLNVKDLQMMFDAMPFKSFKPSFSQNEIENCGRLQPTSDLVPKFDYQSLSFEGFNKTKAYLEQPTTNFATQFAPRLCFEVNMVGEALNVPLASKVKSKEDSVHMEMRCVLFDMASKSYCSSFYIMGVQPLLEQGLGKTQET
jgi:hypothetical protein